MHVPELSRVQLACVAFVPFIWLVWTIWYFARGAMLGTEDCIHCEERLHSNMHGFGESLELLSLFHICDYVKS
jgi:hypothetical protein